MTLLQDRCVTRGCLIGFVALLVGGLLALSAAPVDAAIKPGGRVVRSLNHVTTVVSPSAGPALFAKLTSLGLKVLWPFQSYGSYGSGGVALGVVNLEVIGATQAVLPFPRFITFVPESDTGLAAELARRHVAAGAQEPTPPASSGMPPIFTVTPLTDLQNYRNFLMQLSYYTDPAFDAHNAPTAASGNKAGIHHVNRVRITVSRKLRGQLSRLMAPIALGPYMQFGSTKGGMLGVRTGRSLGLTDVVVSVRNVKVAVAAFRAAGFRVRGTLVSVGNLPLRLVPLHRGAVTGRVTMAALN